MFSCAYCEIFKNTYFEEHLQTIASYFMKKNRQLKTKQLKEKLFKSMEIYGFSISYENDTNLNKYQEEKRSALRGRNLDSTYNRRVKSVPARQVEIFPANRHHANNTLNTSLTTEINWGDHCTKISFPLRISLVNVKKSARNRKTETENIFFCPADFLFHNIFCSEVGQIVNFLQRIIHAVRIQHFPIN